MGLIKNLGAIVGIRAKPQLEKKRKGLLQGAPPKNLRGWVIAYSPEFQRFLGKNPFTIGRAFRLIQRNFDALELGSLKEIEFGGVKIETKYTGSHRGDRNNLLLKASVAGKEFFIKITDTHHEDAAAFPQIYSITTKLLASKKNNINGFKVRMIKPHALYFRRKGEKRRSFVVTDFYEKELVQLAMDLPQGPLRNIIDLTVKSLGRELMEKGVEDCDLHNAFYQEKTNTILLFDLRPPHTEEQ